ncbi:Stk1 family PASTA domain-containing Ser/Thr kinase [Marinococcus luteus]|uniref:Stk1 family PASTA domain-containing Ser/Thr kinase n=1 Tax=Marinococcus luteus TaxID=1122204 RepID=UPI002ACC528C|nr:Stk1 family PASTA domain-containing Ser/Thr kinase [Marinococcus luteus]MDZ5781765.1 Stk1 family PASTA domain-containing Ser/Thr kinase [Marinococcus luteus]
MDQLIGRRISDRYHIKRLLGSGGMAYVYLGEDMILERLVAIKILQPQFNGDEEFLQRFRRESRAATILGHRNTVNIYDVGEERELHYIVMEYVEGQTVKEMIRLHGPLPLAQAVHITRQLLEALMQAHSHGIIHRDIKPHNLLSNDRGEIKVADFGIARAASASTITQTNTMMGSVHYISPEQARGGVVSARSDIYAAGIVLFEMVTGVIPYDAESAVSIALKHIQEPLPDPMQLRQGLPQSLSNVILKAAAKSPDDRYASAEEMYEDIRSALSDERRNERPYFIQEGYTNAREREWSAPQVAEEDTMVAAPAVQEDEQQDSGLETKGDRQPEKTKKWPYVVACILVFSGAAIFYWLLPEMFVVSGSMKLIPHVFPAAQTAVWDAAWPGEGQILQEGAKIWRQVEL